MRGIGGFASGDQLAQLDRGRTHHWKARSRFGDAEHRSRRFACPRKRGHPMPAGDGSRRTPDDGKENLAPHPRSPPNRGRISDLERKLSLPGHADVQARVIVQKDGEAVPGRPDASGRAAPVFPLS